MFERMVAAGQVRPAIGKASWTSCPPPAGPPGAESLSETLLEMRDEERY